MPQLKLTHAIHQPSRWQASVEWSPLAPDAPTKLCIVSYSASGAVLASGSTLWPLGASEGISDAILASWLEFELGDAAKCDLAAWSVQRQWADHERRINKQ